MLVETALGEFGMVIEVELAEEVGVLGGVLGWVGGGLGGGDGLLGA